MFYFFLSCSLAGFRKSFEADAKQTGNTREKEIRKAGMADDHEQVYEKMTVDLVSIAIFAVFAVLLWNRLLRPTQSRVEMLDEIQTRFGKCGMKRNLEKMHISHYLKNVDCRTTVLCFLVV